MKTQFKKKKKYEMACLVSGLGAPSADLRLGAGCWNDVHCPEVPSEKLEKNYCLKRMKHFW